MTCHAYINDFLYVVVRPDNAAGQNSLIYCSGVNITRFREITRGLHGLSSNPAIRGLQRVKHGVSSLALSKGGSPKDVRGKDCAGIVPTRDTWYSELLRIDGAPDSLPEEIVSFAVMDLIKKILIGCCLNIAPPDHLPGPDDLQAFLESLITA